jgi:hypothetical protein
VVWGLEVKRILQRLGGPIGAAISAVVGAAVVAVAGGALGVDRTAALGAAGAILTLGGVAVGIACRRSLGKPAVAGTAALTALGLVCGTAAALVPAVLAAQGFDIDFIAPWLFAAIAVMGLAGEPRSRMLWWVPCGLGVGFVAWVGFGILPADPGLAGYEPPPDGSDATVSWSADGAAVEIVYPLDGPVVIVNGEVRRADAEAAERRLQQTGAACSDADGEERAAAEAVISGDRDQAIARARLALQICEDATYAREVLGASLLARGITRMRSGKAGEAVADLEEAIGLLRDEDDLARAHLALGRAMEALSRVDEARGHFETAAELAPSHPAGRAAAAELR